MSESLSNDGSVRVTDEVVNSSLHMIAAVFAMLGAAMIVIKAAGSGSAVAIVSSAVYASSLFLLFLASALHHGISASVRVKNFLRLLDYVAIFILIAGSITPLALAGLGGSVGWALFGTAWATATIGITLKIIRPGLPKWVSNTLYLTMGWLPLAVVVPIYRVLPFYGLVLAVVGGLFYSGGAIIFAIERPNPFPEKFGFHEIWHIAVMLGALSHYMLLYWFVFG